MTTGRVRVSGWDLRIFEIMRVRVVHVRGRVVMGVCLRVRATVRESDDREIVWESA